MLELFSLSGFLLKKSRLIFKSPVATIQRSSICFWTFVMFVESFVVFALKLKF